MNIPAYTSSELCLGRTFDREKLKACGDISWSGNDIPKKSININKFSFKYQVVKSSKDVSDLLHVSGELSLKLKANLLEVEGAGQFVKESKFQEGRTNLLVVMKCTTLVETIAGSLVVRDDVSIGDPLQSLGTHYVRSVTYGVEMVASLTFKSSSESSKDQIKGMADGKLDVGGSANVGLKAALDKLAKECNDVTDISIKYYATDRLDQLPTTIKGLVSLIEEFPSRLKNMNDGKGIPMQFELQPVSSIIPNAKANIQQQVLSSEIEELESQFDDIRNTQALVEAYLEVRQDDDVDDFCSELTKLQRKFKAAIQTLNSVEGPKKIKECMEAYENARGGRASKGKFSREWKKILKSKKPVATIKLPSGEPLTIVLFGKTGNGKSATGNSIIGRKYFKASPSAESVTKNCKSGTRNDEREVTVIDTPGIMDTAEVSNMGRMIKEAALNLCIFRNNNRQREILQELAKVFAMSPKGLDALLITVKYGSRFCREDSEALKVLKEFFGPEAIPYIILIFTHGDEAVFHAEEMEKTTEDHLKCYIDSLPKWVQKFIEEIEGRRVLFNNRLNLERNPDDCKKQLSNLLQIIDGVKEKQKGPLIHYLTKVSEEQLNEVIARAMEETGLARQEKEICRQQEKIKRQLEEEQRVDAENHDLKNRLAELEIKMEEWEAKKRQLEEEKREQQRKEAETESGGEATENIRKKSRGCYPGSAIIYDSNSRARRMESLQLGDEVLVITNNGIQSDTVITFIHRQPEIVEEFLKIVTTKEKVLLITVDHLLFVEVLGQAAAIPARDVKIGDTVYVRGSHGSKKDSVRSISTVYEKGAYAPVTLSGTILVNDVHTSCYFDVLSHEWSHRAMGIARALHYLSPSLVQRISAVGEKDGFPGWCRLAHTMLTLLD